MTKKFKLNIDQIRYIQRTLCKTGLQGGPKVDRRLKRDNPKRTFRVPSPECVAKEIKEREKHGETIRAGFIDDIICKKEKFKYVTC